MTALVGRNAALRDVDACGQLGLGHVESLADGSDAAHGPNIGTTNRLCQQCYQLMDISIPNMVPPHGKEGFT